MADYARFKNNYVFLKIPVDVFNRSEYLLFINNALLLSGAHEGDEDMMTLTSAILRSIEHSCTVRIAFAGDTSDLMAACIAAVGGECNSTEKDVVFGTDAEGGEYQLRIV